MIMEEHFKQDLDFSHPSLPSHGQQRLQVIVKDNARAILGDVHYHGSSPQFSQDIDRLKSFGFGLCLGHVPYIEPDAFKGRATELEQLQNWLLPAKDPQQQCIVSITGLGGMGKTQLSIAYARQCANFYSSVFWVSAKDEATLRQELANLSTIIFQSSGYTPAGSEDDEKRQLEQVRRWLSESDNGQWLLIFDNYDDPRLPGIGSKTGYDIRPYFPIRSHGSILITTRSTKLAFSRQLPLGKLKDLSTSVSILSQRSGRDLFEGKMPNLNKFLADICRPTRIRSSDTTRWPPPGSCRGWQLLGRSERVLR